MVKADAVVYTMAPARGVRIVDDARLFWGGCRVFRPLKQIWERFETDKADSDGAAFSCLLLIGEMIVKVAVAGLVAAVGDDRERSRYQQSYRLVRSDGVGEWVEVLDEILIGPSAQTLAPEARVEARELTQKVGLESWQYEAVSLLHECLRMIDSSTGDLPTKVDLRRWFQISPS